MSGAADVRGKGDLGVELQVTDFTDKCSAAFHKKNIINRVLSLPPRGCKVAKAHQFLHLIFHSGQGNLDKDTISLKITFDKDNTMTPLEGGFLDLIEQ